MYTLKGKAFYRTKEWYAFRQIVMNKRRDRKGLLRCEHCGEVIYNKADAILHHKIELTESNVNDLSISFNESNIMVIHRRCHDEIHNRFGAGKKEVYIVWGAPCSGKSSYVNSLCHRDDLVIDKDIIYHMLNTKNQLYDKVDRHTAVMFQVEKRLLEIVRDRYGMWHNAYIITCENIEEQLERMAMQFDAHLIHIDTDKEECVANLLNDKDKELFKTTWLKYIDDYFDEYTKPSYEID